MVASSGPEHVTGSGAQRAGTSLSDHVWTSTPQLHDRVESARARIRVDAASPIDELPTVLAWPHILIELCLGAIATNIDPIEEGAPAAPLLCQHIGPELSVC